MTLQTIWEERGVYQRLTDILSEEYKELAQREVFENPRFETLKYWIIDTLDIDVYLLGQSQARDAAAQDLGARTLNQDLLMVFVTTHPDHLKNIEHYKNALEKARGAWKIGVFHTVAAAREWIDQELSKSQPPPPHQPDQRHFLAKEADAPEP